MIPQMSRGVEHGLTIFVYHDVTNQPSQFAQEYGLAVSIETFSRQMSWIRSHFNIIHPRDILNKRELPPFAAVISFDDGFLGVFNNALPVLREMGMPSVIFLNMKPILEQKPTPSAIACYLTRYKPDIFDFMKSAGISAPLHLSLSPVVLEFVERLYGSLDRDAVYRYQGKFAELDTVRSWHDEDSVVYGNHFFDHWNAAALTLGEIEEQYKKNECALWELNNRINLFAFTNGQPGACFSEREISLFLHLGAERLFSSSGSINRDPNQYLLDRLSMDEGDRDQYRMSFKVGFGLVNRHFRIASRRFYNAYAENERLLRDR